MIFYWLFHHDIIEILLKVVLNTITTLLVIIERFSANLA